MVSRRLLRIKAMQVLYAYFKANNQAIQHSEKELFFSIKKTYDLYHYLLLLIIDISQLALKKIDIAKQKRIPTYEDLHPNTRFVENQLINKLSRNRHLFSYINNNKMSWVNYPELVKKLYNEITNCEAYKEYMTKEKHGFNDDKQIIIYIYTHLISDCDLLYQILEEQSIYWNDDVEFVISMIIKTLKRFKHTDTEDTALMPLFKNSDDREFVKTLYRKAIVNHEQYKELIKKYSKNWDIERIAFIDIILLSLALVEITQITSIPTKVTFNEYIEIAKFYSTKKSSIFINGILNRIVEALRDEKLIIT